MRAVVRGLGLVLAATLISACVVRVQGGWELLGRRDVEFGRDRDSIEVGRAEGRFAELRFTVRGGDIEVYDMRVIFADGSDYRPDTRLEFKNGSESRPFNLPGAKRAIRRVDFVYRSQSRRDGKATLSLFGR